MKNNRKLLTVLIFTVIIVAMTVIVASAKTVTEDMLSMVEDHPGYMIDYDGNNKVNKDDALYLLYHTFFPNDYPLTECKNENCTADINEDNKKNSEDALFVLYAVFDFEEQCPLEKHAEVDVKPVEATCSEKGLKGGSYCSYCGDFTELPEYVDTTTHFAINAAGKYSTCFICEASVDAENRDMIVWLQPDENGESYAVYDASGLVAGKVTIPDKVEGKPVTKIGDSAFYLGAYITEIIIPDTVTEIGKQAFAECKNLETLVIPKNVTKIGRLAFDGCASLKSITIPSSVVYIGDYAFSGSAIESIAFETTEFWTGFKDNDNITINIPATEIADPKVITEKLFGDYKEYVLRQGIFVPVTG